MKPTQEQIDEQIDKAIDKAMESEGRSRWPGMTYEQGVDAALRWATGASDEAPMDGDD
jgi:hypothetical protein